MLFLNSPPGNFCTVTYILCTVFTTRSTAQFSDPLILLNCSVPEHYNHAVLTAQWAANKTHFLLHLEAQTLGWVAFGISPTGQMDNADVIFGWCNDDSSEIPKCHAQNRFVHVNVTFKRVNLLADKVQEWTLIFGHQSATHTTLRLMRRLETRNPRGYSITKEITAIFAVGTYDPDLASGEVGKHAYRGSRKLQVLEDPVQPLPAVKQQPSIPEISSQSAEEISSDNVYLKLIIKMLGGFNGILRWMTLASSGQNDI